MNNSLKIIQHSTQNIVDVDQIFTLSTHSVFNLKPLDKR